VPQLNHSFQASVLQGLENQSIRKRSRKLPSRTLGELPTNQNDWANPLWRYSSYTSCHWTQ